MFPHAPKSKKIFIFGFGAKAYIAMAGGNNRKNFKKKLKNFLKNY